MATIKHILPSGAEVTDEDLKSIQKATSRENLKTGLAIVGVGAIIIFVRGMMMSTQVTFTPDEH